MNSIITYKQGEEASRLAHWEYIKRSLFALKFELASRRNKPQRLQVTDPIDIGCFRVVDRDAFNKVMKS